MVNGKLTSRSYNYDKVEGVRGVEGGKRVGERGAEKKRSKVQVVCDDGGGRMRGLP